MLGSWQKTSVASSEKYQWMFAGSTGGTAKSMLNCMDTFPLRVPYTGTGLTTLSTGNAKSRIKLAHSNNNNITPWQIKHVITHANTHPILTPNSDREVAPLDISGIIWYESVAGILSSSGVRYAWHGEAGHQLNSIGKNQWRDWNFDAGICHCSQNLAAAISPLDIWHWSSKYSAEEV